MCLNMARDLGLLGIRVLAIAPSLFATGATAPILEEMAAALVRAAAFVKRMGRPEEYARLALAIVDTPMPNGQCLRLDAGQRFAPRWEAPGRLQRVRLRGRKPDRRLRTRPRHGQTPRLSIPESSGARRCPSPTSTVPGTRTPRSSSSSLPTT